MRYAQLHDSQRGQRLSRYDKAIDAITTNGGKQVDQRDLRSASFGNRRASCVHPA